MALLFLESFDHYGANTSLLTRKWTAIYAGSGTRTFVTGRPGSGPSALSLNSLTQVRLTLSTLSRWIVGFAWKAAPRDSGGFTIPIVQFVNSTGGVEIDLAQLPDSRLIVRRGGSTTIGTGTRALQENQWYYIEIDVTINTTSGAARVRVNEVDEIVLTNVNTSGGGTNGASQLYLASSNGQSNVFDDLYICDASGTVNNSLLGNTKVIALFPNGVGSSTQWTPTGAANNWACVSETSPDDDTTYVSSATASQRDLYALQDLLGNETVRGVQVSLMARKDDAGTRQIRSVLKLGAAVVTGPTYSIDNSYIYYRSLHDLAPDGTTWDPTKVNALEVGVDLVV